MLALEWFAPTPGGPAGSSYATAPAGAAAYAELLRARRARGRSALREPLAEAGEIGRSSCSSRSTSTRRRRRAIGRRVRDGMRLVAGGGATGWLRDVLAEPPAKGDGAPGRARGRRRGAGDRRGSAAVRLPRAAASWAQLGQTEPLLATASGPVAVAAGQGEGRVVLLADPTPLLNGALADADNAAFALDAAPAGRVAFLESIHGYPTPGCARSPTARSGRCSASRRRAPLVWSMARRLGPPEDEERGSRRRGATTPRRSPPRSRRAATRRGCGPRRRGSEWRPPAPGSIPTSPEQLRRSRNRPTPALPR